MAQIPSLIDTLKKQLKANGATYADVAVALEVSEASVKRLFAEHSFSLQRLEAICQFIGLQLSELILLMEKEQPQLHQLTEQQEKEIIADPLLLLISISIVNGHTFDDLCAHIDMSKTECITKLAHLDRIKIIDLLPNNRIKLLISPNFKWRANGPIQQFFQQHIEKDFFQSTFNSDQEKLLVLNGELSERANQEFQKKMSKLAKEFNALMQEDSTLPIEQRHNTTVVLASRSWEFKLFDQFRK